MADVKISQLTALASANVVTSSDVLPIVDASVPQTKKITVENLLSPITIDKSAGTITSLGTIAGNVVINNASNPTYLQIGSSLADDPYMVFQSDGNTFAMGIDRSDSNRFKISDNATLGTNDRFEIDATGLNIFKYEGAENSIQIHSGVGSSTTGVSQIYFSSKDEYGGNTHQSYIKSTIDGTSSTSATKMTFHNRKSDGNVHEVLTLEATGRMTTAGDIVPGADVILSNGRGISFANMDNASGMTSELLDDYEEGTYTISITGATSGSWTMKSGYGTASYTKIGRLVTVTARYETSSATSRSGNLRFNLPFAVKDLTDQAGGSAGSITVNRSAYTITDQITPVTFDGVQYFDVQRHENGQNETYLQASDIDGTFEGHFTLTYVTN